MAGYKIMAGGKGLLMKINKLRGSLIITAVIIIAVLILVVSRPWGRKPFKDLSAEDISSVSLELMPPGRTFDLTTDQITDLADGLQDIIIYKEEPLEPLAGQAVIFNITYTDGTTVKVEPMGSLMQIDGVRYQTKYEPSEELNRFANGIEQES